MSVSPAGTHAPQMTQSSNAALVAATYDNFARGDIPAVLAVFAEDISWHISGRSPVSGIYTGHDEVLDFFGLLGQLSNGTFRLEIHNVLGDESGDVAVLTTEYAERNGATGVFAAVHVWRIEGGKATRFQAYMGDEYSVDEFWSS